jgi:hypothetical protein
VVRGRATIGEIEIAGGTLPNADAVVSEMRAGFRACYQRGLASDAELRGSIRVAAELGTDGVVTHATVESTGRLSQETTDCVLRRVRAASFAAPSGDRVSVKFAVSFD